MNFDEAQLIKYINSRLEEAGRTAYPDDEILNIVDMIWDFYETRGLLDPDGDEEPERADIEPEIVAYALTLLRRDKNSKVENADIPLIVSAELDYEDMILENPDELPL